MNYYNAIDPQAAQWIRNLIAAGEIPDGIVDTRSIEDVVPSDLTGFTQCHFFAGIAGWSVALSLAGWPSSRRVWTGSCPCQPFSAAGKGAGFADERHLWPAWFHLIDECRPPVIFGEQVASAAVGPWIDLVQADLESLGNAFGCVPFPAAGVGAPHIRDRTYWVAHASSEGLSEQHGRWVEPARFSTADGAARRLADSNGRNASAERQQCGGEQRQQPQDGGSGGMEHPNGLRRHWGPRSAQEVRRELCEPIDGQASEAGGLGYTDRKHEASQPRVFAGSQSSAARGELRPGPTNGFWRDADWLGCTDGKWRPVEPGTFPLAHGVSNRVGRLRAYGNAIVPAQAAEFILATGLI